MRSFLSYLPAILLGVLVTCVLSVAVSAEVERPIQKRFYISVVGDSTDAQYQAITAMFDTAPGLLTLRSESNYFEVETSSSIYRERYEPNVEGLPTVRVQRRDGVVVYEECGDSIPDTPEVLEFEIRFSELCFDTFLTQGYETSQRRNVIRRCCPIRRKQEQETPPEIETKIPPPLEAKVPVQRFPWANLGLFAAALLIGAGYTLYKQWPSMHGSYDDEDE